VGLRDDGEVSKLSLEIPGLGKPLDHFLAKRGWSHSLDQVASGTAPLSDVIRLDAQLLFRRSHARGSLPGRRAWAIS